MSSFQDALNDFFSFLGSKLKNFKNLTVGEQVAFSSIALGIILVLTSIVLFVF